MAYLNANIPPIYAQIRKEYLYDNKKHHGEVEDCIVFGISCITGRRYTYGTQLWKTVQSFIVYPITAFIQRDFQPSTVPIKRLDELELWNSFSYYPAITTYDILSGQHGKYIGKDKKWHHGNYLIYR